MMVRVIRLEYLPHRPASIATDDERRKRLRVANVNGERME